MDQLKKIVITGISSGFGRATAEILADSGHQILALVRGGRARIETLGSPSLQRALSIGKLQVLDADFERGAEETARQVRAWVDREWSGRLDALVNNAGFGVFGPGEEVEISELRRQFEVNYFAPMALVRALSGPLRVSRGVLVQVSSIVGRIVLPFYGPYSASKHALEASTEAYSHELSRAGVRVHLIEPGGFKTRFVQNVRVQTQSNHPGFMRFQAFHAKKSATVGGDPVQVARRIVRLIEKPSHTLRHPLGVDSWVALILQRIFPDRVRVALTRLLFRTYLG